MSRRIEIELTSSREDGSWTWRAAGAKQPKGALDGAVLPEGAKVGDVLRADADFELDGITILTTAPSTPKKERREPERIEVVGTRRADEPLVTSQLVGKRGGGGRDRRDRPDGDRPRRPRPDGERGERRPRPDGERRPRADGERGERRPRPDGDRPRRTRPDGEQGAERRDRRPRFTPPPELETRPKPKRLRAGRVHRKAVLAELSPEQQPIAEQVLRGGLGAVRQAIDAENATRSAAGQPNINAPELIALAEQVLPRLRAAEWRDRAEAALADAGEIDLRDLRSVVVASDTAARDDETRELAAKLRVALEERVEAEHANWLSDMQAALDVGRVVRALRLSSRPPKAGAMLPPDLRTRLVEGSAAGLTAEITADRWAALLDALAYSPVRGDVVPASKPEQPSDELVAAVTRYAGRVPKVAEAFGITAPEGGGRAPRSRGPRSGAKRLPPKPRPSGAGPTDAAAADGTPPDPSTTSDPVVTTAAPAPGDDAVVPVEGVSSDAVTPPTPEAPDTAAPDAADVVAPAGAPAPPISDAAAAAEEAATGTAAVADDDAPTGPTHDEPITTEADAALTDPPADGDDDDAPTGPTHDEPITTEADAGLTDPPADGDDDATVDDERRPEG